MIRDIHRPPVDPTAATIASQNSGTTGQHDHRRSLTRPPSGPAVGPQRNLNIRTTFVAHE
jgi:hypothetical protein